MAMPQGAHLNLDELLREPMIISLMDKDGVSPAHVRALVERLREGRGDRGARSARRPAGGSRTSQ
jgi:hypothetical protein